MNEQDGQRARKSRRLGLSVERAALELALQHGFGQTTVEQIAARADVAPRTVFSRYLSKEAVFFGSEDELELFRPWLEGDDATLIERLQRFITQVAESSGEEADLKRLRLQAIMGDPELRRIMRGRLGAAEDLIATQVARELALGPQDPVTVMIAAAFGGVFLALVGDSVTRGWRRDEVAASEASRVSDLLETWIRSGQALAQKRNHG